MGKREKEEARIDYEAMFDHDCLFEGVDVDAPDPLPGDVFNAFQQTSAIPLITLPDTILPIMEQEEDEFEVEEDEYKVESEVESEAENKVANKEEVYEEESEKEKYEEHKKKRKEKDEQLEKEDKNEKKRKIDAEVISD
jgi:hypothetical protein